MDRRFLPQGAELGPSGVHYRVCAPVCERLDIEVQDGSSLRQIPMRRRRDGYFHGFDEQGRAGDLYQFLLNGTQRIPDPASRFQPQGVHGPSMVVNPYCYQWCDGGWVRPAFRDLVIYELHVGTFTPEGTFVSAKKKLQYLSELGVNAIEIMPVGDFAGERNWGYDGVYLFAPAHSYGSPDDLRALVDAAHALGIAVILDVVYNHFGPDGNYLASYIGDYLDESQKTPWGGAIRYGHPQFKPLRELVVANPEYWMREFHIDGFRLDATHEIRDDSPQHILKELVAAIHARGGYAIAEDPRNEANLLLPQERGGIGFDGVWADDFHHSVRVSNTHECESYLGDFTGELSEVVDTIRHGWHYRGQFSRTSGGPRGTECRHIPPERFVHCISNHDQTGNRAFGERLHHSISPEAYRVAAALLCLAPCTPMLFMGQEWGTSSPFLFFTDHNPQLGKLVTTGRREEFKDFEAFQNQESRDRIPDPQEMATLELSKLNWREFEETEKRQTLALYRACLSLRKTEQGFRPTSRDSWLIEELESGIGALRYRSAGAHWLLLFDLIGRHGGSLDNEWVCTPPAGAYWSLVLSTEEERFGGRGMSAWSGGATRVEFEKPELLVLRSKATFSATSGC